MHRVGSATAPGITAIRLRWVATSTKQPESAGWHPGKALSPKGQKSCHWPQPPPCRGLAAHTTEFLIVGQCDRITGRSDSGLNFNSGTAILQGIQEQHDHQVGPMPGDELPPFPFAVDSCRCGQEPAHHPPFGRGEKATMPRDGQTRDFEEKKVTQNR